MSIRKPGSPTFWRASQSIPSKGSTNCCHGIGALPSGTLIKPPEQKVTRARSSPDAYSARGRSHLLLQGQASTRSIACRAHEDAVRHRPDRKGGPGDPPAPLVPECADHRRPRTVTSMTPPAAFRSGHSLCLWLARAERVKVGPAWFDFAKQFGTKPNELALWTVSVRQNGAPPTQSS